MIRGDQSSTEHLSPVCLACGGIDPDDLRPESPVHPQIFVHQHCLNTEETRAWRRARELENPAYTRYRFLMSAGAEVICGECHLRHWLWPKSIGMGAGSWQTHCTRCYRVGQAVSPVMREATDEDVASRIEHLRQRFLVEGQTPSITVAMQTLAKRYDAQANPNPCSCGGWFSLAASPRCKRCGHILYETYFNYALPPRASDFAYQSLKMPSQRQWNSSATQLRMAIERRNLKKIRKLLAAGADVDTPDGYGCTVLMAAARSGNTDVVKALIGHKATANTQDHRGWTALMWAAHQGSTGIVDALLTAGADVTMQNQGGRTALMMAVCEGHVEIVRRLLAHGADVNSRDRDGWTALHWAEEWERTEVVAILKSSGSE
jgi:Ankyrin repeats (3 copies)/Ankyrin repeats (many copies)